MERGQRGECEGLGERRCVEEGGEGRSWSFFIFQAEDGIRVLVRSRGLGDVYKRQLNNSSARSSEIQALN